jgi:hypothetical protein
VQPPLAVPLAAICARLFPEPFVLLVLMKFRAEDGDQARIDNPESHAFREVLFLGIIPFLSW